MKAMAKRKAKDQRWSDVKAAINKMDGKQLLGLVSDLYRLSRENQSFLHARFGIGSALEPYKKTISDCMYPDMDKPIQISKAKKAISSYSKAVGDPNGEAELMTFFVECGNKFTVDYGDINEAFYDALVSMFRRVIDKVFNLPEGQREVFQRRLKSIVDSSANIGWFYHDRLVDAYYDAFPEKE